jgi:hypothetical protein
MPVPDLPLDIFYVVACHLAGMYAFGTLAALHLAKHAIEETVLPVMYETVLLDNMEELPSGEEGKDEGRKDKLRRYTK